MNASFAPDMIQSPPRRTPAGSALTGLIALALIGLACTKSGADPTSRATQAEKVVAAADATSTSGGKQSTPQSANGNEWANWRGPEFNGVSHATGLPEAWNTPEENLIWKADIGGRTTPIVLNHKVFLIRAAGAKPDWKEEVACLDADTGKLLWEYKFDLFHTDIPLDRVGWSNVVADPETGNIYAHGVQGTFVALDQNGKLLWQKSFTEDYGRISGYGGRTHTPMVDQDLVIISFLTSGLGPQGKGLHRYVAMDKRTGVIRWWSEPGLDPEDTTYSCPVVAVINGQRLLIAPNGDGWIYALKVNTGEKVWSFALSKRGINVSPIIDGNHVIVAHSEDNFDNAVFGRLVCIDAAGQGDITKTNEVWRFDGFEGGYSSPTIHDGRIYIPDNGSRLFCVDAATGKMIWKTKLGRVAKSSPVWADGRLYYAEDNGTYFILDPGDKECKVLSKLSFKSPDERVIDMKGSTAVAYGRLYFMNRDTIFCLGKKDAKPADIVIPALADTGPGAAPAAHLQITPAEVQIPPDGEATFTATQFDAKGRLIGPAEVKWTPKGIKGAINEKGVFIPDPSVNGQFGLIEAAAGDLKGTTRVRILPTLPISEDFEKIAEGAAPSYWIGASKVKFTTIIQDGNHVLKKDADNIKFQRASIYIGGSDMSNYTITADMSAQKRGTNLPDMGVINSRYQFDLLGNYQQLRLIGWTPMPRIVKLIDFPWHEGDWFTLKCRVDYAKDKATVRGKIWKRGEAEPAAWTLEMEDPAPYMNGSPGLVCFSLAEVYFDNIKIEKSN